MTNSQLATCRQEIEKLLQGARFLLRDNTLVVLPKTAKKFNLPSTVIRSDDGLEGLIEKVRQLVENYKK